MPKSQYRPATRLVHGGIERSHHGETAEALFLTSGFVYDDVRMAAKCGPDIIYLDGAEGGTGAGPHVAAGSTVTFTYVVTDTGTNPLANVAVTDDKLGTITSFTGDTNNNEKLDPDET